MQQCNKNDVATVGKKLKKVVICLGNRYITTEWNSAIVALTGPKNA